MTLNALLSGAIVMAALTIALFFFRFWHHTRDRFFLYFAVAFALEALHRALWALDPQRDTDTPHYYLIRLASYLLILLAIVNKNRTPPR